MAAARVNSKQTGSASTATLTITSATAGNYLVMFINQELSLVAPKGKDNLGESGWVVNENDAAFTTSKNSLYMATKVAAGGETKLEPVAGTAGTVQGISYVEISGLGATPTVDLIKVFANNGSVTTLKMTGLTTTGAGDILLGAIGLSAASGVVELWTASSGSALTNSDVSEGGGKGATTRCLSGYLVPGETITSREYTATWGSARTNGGLFVALKPTTEEATARVMGMLI